MKRPVRPEEQRLWAHVAATVHPAAGRKIAMPKGETPPKPRPEGPAALPPPRRAGEGPFVPGAHARTGDPDVIEPNRKRRIAKGKDSLEARIDLHGLDYDGAQMALKDFVRRAFDDGYRSALVITGKGALGDGVLRKHTPEWLADPSLRDMVAGISEADRKHGGEGALYVALKRKVKT